MLCQTSYSFEFIETNEMWVILRLRPRWSAYKMVFYVLMIGLTVKG